MEDKCFRDLFPDGMFLLSLTGYRAQVSHSAMSSVFQARMYLESAEAQLSQITLSAWQGNAAQSAQEEHARLIANIGQARASATQTTWALNVLQQEVSSKVMCAAITGVY